VLDQTQGTINYGITSGVTSGTDKWNIYAFGAAQNYFAGNVQFAAGSAAAPALTRFGDTNTGIFFPAADTIAFSEGGAEAMRIDSAGNVGIGVTNPLFKLHVNDRVFLGGVVFNNNTTSFLTSNNPEIYGTSTGGSGIFNEAGHLVLQPRTSGALRNIVFATGIPAVERARISADGTFRVKGAGTAGSTDAFQVAGTAPASAMVLDSSGVLSVTGNIFTGAVGSTQRNITLATTGGSVVIVSHSTGDVNGDLYAAFNYNGGQIGSITQNSTTGVLYNITSDYRLKTVIGPVADAGQRIDALQPVEYTWNSNGSRTRGFLAHQFQEVYAGSVSGTKDAVDAEGKPVYQSMQASTSEVIADLVAELQSLRARVASLESSTLQ
jgi:hypothetical protein